MIGTAVLVLATTACIGMARRARAIRVVGGAAPALAADAPAPAWLVGGLERADVPIAATLVARAWLASVAVVTAGAVVVGGVALAVLALVATTASLPVALHLARHRADRRLEADLPDVLDALARSLRTGASLRQAIVEVAAAAHGPLGADLQRVAREVREGVAVADALDGWLRRRALRGVRLTATALALGADTGGASARAVDGLAQTLRTNVAIEAEVRALSSQARLSALVIALAPLGFTTMAAAVDERTARFLLRTPAGLACLVLGLGLDAIGALWMRRVAVVRA